ncbi:unnamed protein product [Heterobilharzia americana]|nr:unnamed protein product [Heterobilharzia americana]CAH8508184.1 unnamed protein product [Heterobilharzia americana]
MTEILFILLCNCYKLVGNSLQCLWNLVRGLTCTSDKVETEISNDNQYYLNTTYFSFIRHYFLPWYKSFTVSFISYGLLFLILLLTHSTHSILNAKKLYVTGLLFMNFLYIWCTFLKLSPYLLINVSKEDILSGIHSQSIWFNKHRFNQFGGKYAINNGVNHNISNSITYSFKCRNIFHEFLWIKVYLSIYSDLTVHVIYISWLWSIGVRIDTPVDWIFHEFLNLLMCKNFQLTYQSFSCILLFVSILTGVSLKI